MNACNTVGRREDVMALHYISGFGDLAKFIASDHDGDTAIFRRFDILSARNLLYLQSELAELEYLQCQYDEEDARDGVQAGLSKPINLASRDWSSFNRGANDSNSPINERLKKRMDLVVAIREKLKEYREALVLESTILSMRRPSMQAHGAFNRQFWNERHGQRSFPALEGYGETLYEDRAQLVALKRADNEDRLTHILRRFCPMLFRLGGRNTRNSGVEYFSAARISVVVNTVSVLLAAALLFGAIYNLYYVDQDQVKLGLIAVYTLAFALSVSVMSNARRAEVFGASAAYAAVLVVFVSGDLGRNQNPG